MKLHWHTPRSARQSRLSRWLRAFGPSWSASPLRRIIQTACFALFLLLFFYVAWPHGAGDFSDIRQRKEWIDIDLFLTLDPLVSLTAALAARAWVPALGFAAAMIALSLLLPRAFCGYLCPMGTLIDLADWAVGKRFKRFHLRRPGWWRNLRYYLLAAVLAAAAGGIILTGYLAAIPLVTRGFTFTLAPLESALLRGWASVPAFHAAHWVSIALFLGVLSLGLLRPRFWCRHVCPTGAVFSIFNLFRITERQTQPHCIQCGKCAKECSFDAINDDFTTVPANCAFCQTCGGICPVDAIHFTHRLTPRPQPVTVRGAAVSPPPLAPPAPDLSRRTFLIGASTGVVAGGLAAAGLRLTAPKELPPVLRPPGAAPEATFVSLCVRCGQCLRVCPTGVLQPLGLAHGLNRLWTPWANADFAGCQRTCNNCGQVCPTHAIQALSREQKDEARMGLAAVNTATCLQCQGRKDCEVDAEGGKSLLCVEACPYSALQCGDDARRVPIVIDKDCRGCGLCQAECYRVNVLEKRLLQAAAVFVTPLAQPPATTIPAGTPATTPQPASQPTITDVPYGA